MFSISGDEYSVLSPIGPSMSLSKFFFLDVGLVGHDVEEQDRASCFEVCAQEDCGLSESHSVVDSDDEVGQLNGIVDTRLRELSEPVAKLDVELVVRHSEVGVEDQKRLVDHHLQIQVVCADPEPFAHGVAVHLEMSIQIRACEHFLRRAVIVVVDLHRQSIHSLQCPIQTLVFGVVELCLDGAALGTEPAADLHVVAVNCKPVLFAITGGRKHGLLWRVRNVLVAAAARTPNIASPELFPMPDADPHARLARRLVAGRLMQPNRSGHSHRVPNVQVRLGGVSKISCAQAHQKQDLHGVERHLGEDMGHGALCQDEKPSGQRERFLAVSALLEIRRSGPD
ncbi:hypothetical protein OGAPHI_003205 [Ogataea philodendri]|uniref:Uncharacterized protein n=1 Tax=Ogataea philodendri TaxID=1378263 RepID=A0A9P8T6A0_9ASCO|nr:uncharacterized protein OGAPHI_003205 [Ogataea philodendri]KAH3666756.1 hypothetical protein OGAPHI_003205 [Ogataea philodendri]